MKGKIYTIIAFLLCSLNLFSQNYAEQADSAYTSEEYGKAIELYTKAIKESGTSSVIFYNLGNAYYRSGNYGKAILNYNRALKLDPTNSDAQANLDFVNTKIADKQEDNFTLMEKVDNNITTFMSANGWAYLSATLFVMFLLCVSGYIFLNTVKYRKISFFIGVILALGIVFGITYSIKSANRLLDNSEAIITDESVQLGTSPRVPRDKSEQALFLHEGTKIVIMDSVKVTNDAENPLWYEVKVDNSHRAWISAKSVERI